jgi:hypothetical protein
VEGIVMLIIFVSALAVLALASVTWGVDTRDALPDDHHR